VADRLRKVDEDDVERMLTSTPPSVSPSLSLSCVIAVSLPLPLEVRAGSLYSSTVVSSVSPAPKMRPLSLRRGRLASRAMEEEEAEEKAEEEEEPLWRSEGFVPEREYTLCEVMATTAKTKAMTR
jgi:hypothetical protein